MNSRASVVSSKTIFVAAPQEVLWGEDWDLLCLVGFLHNHAHSGSCCWTGMFHLWLQDSRNQHVEVSAPKRELLNDDTYYKSSFCSVSSVSLLRALSSIFKTLQHGGVWPWNRRENCDVSTVWQGMQVLETEQHLWSLESKLFFSFSFSTTVKVFGMFLEYHGKVHFQAFCFFVVFFFLMVTVSSVKFKYSNYSNRFFFF